MATISDHYVTNRETGEVNIVRDDGFNCLMMLYVVRLNFQFPLQGRLWFASPDKRKTAKST